jgi:hypothetical protein
LVAALTLALVAGGLTLLHGGERSSSPQAGGEGTPTPAAAPSPASVEGAELFRMPVPDVPEGEWGDSSGSWVTEHTYAAGGYGSVTGHNLATGRQAWSVDLPGDLCEVSPTVNAGHLIAVVSYDRPDSVKSGSTCARLTVIDVDNGTTVWEHTLRFGRAFSRGLGMSVAVSDRVAAVGWPAGSVGYDLSTGREVWDAPTTGCTAEEHLGGRELVTLAACGKDLRIRVGRRDTDSGRTAWIYDVPQGTHGAWLLSGNPLVLAAVDSPSARDADHLLSVSADGRAARIALDHHETSGCSSSGGTCTAPVIAGDAVHFGTDPLHNGRISGFGLRTGQRREYPAPATKAWIPVRGDGADLIAIETPTLTRQVSVLRLPTRVSLSIDLLHMISDTGRNPVRYDNAGRLFLHRTSLPGTSTGSPLTLAYAPVEPS